MKILVTGSSGFVGTHLVKKLNLNHTVVGYDLVNGQNVLNDKLLSKNLKGVDIVVHLAAFISAEESWNIPKEYLENNALGTLSVVRNSIKAGVKKLIFFSSAAVKAKPLTPYAVSKIAAEEIVNLYKDRINVTIVRPENIYGSGQKMAYGYVIHNFIEAVENGKTIKIYGDGNQTRDFIFVEDVVKTVVRILDMGLKSGTVISLGTGKPTKIIDLAGDVMNVLNEKVKIEFLEARNEPRKSVAETESLKVVGIDPKKFVTLEAGIKRLIKN